jgi:GDP-4-dehydro-6-deoxy-D-mannose reductase
MVFNLCSGRIVAIRDLIDIFQEVSGIRVTVLSEASRTRGGDAPLIAGSFARLNQATGWEPRIPLAQTLSDVYSYWKEEIGRGE